MYFKQRESSLLENKESNGLIIMQLRHLILIFLN